MKTSSPCARHPPMGLRLALCDLSGSGVGAAVRSVVSSSSPEVGDMMFTDCPSMTNEENLQLRDQHIAESCELHFNKDPMKIVKSKDQYLYDELGNQYLDFVTRITNVGHCNSAVVEAACSQMAQLGLAVGADVIQLQHRLAALLLDTLPPNFEVVLFTSSGAEANDLALQMARNFTNRKDLVVVDGSFHGTGNLLADISPRAFKISPEGKKPWVHVVPAPDTYRGPYSADDPEAGEKYFQEAKKVLQRVTSNNHEIAGFICEPVMVVHGMMIPPPDWLSKMYSYIRELGGIVVADEIQCGMGRTGETFWGFQGQNAIPDIMTVGKPLGNGYPIGAVITSRKIAATIKNAEQIYKCDPVGAAIAATVLIEMKDRQLMDSALRLGNMMAEGFRQMQRSHPIIGDVRQKGIIIGVDIVRSGDCKKPAADIADEISNALRRERLLVGCEGEYKNVLLFLPALCISESDVELIVETLDQVIRCIELSFMDDIYDIINSPSPGEPDPEPSTSYGLHRTSPNMNRSSSQHPYDALD